MTEARTGATTQHSSHWGAFQAEIADGRVTGAAPFAADPDPSPILASIPDSLYADSRVARPMIRAGWLEKGPGGNRDRRGAEPFVPVPWDRALDLVAGELDRVRTDHGNAAIFGGSYGWASAGRFHHAVTQTHRFLNCIGGFTTQKQNYSYAAAMTLLPHIVGTAQPTTGPVTSWDAIAAHTDLMVCFGGIPLKNTQVNSGGNGEHTAPSWLSRIREAGVDFVVLGPVRDDAPDCVRAEWLAPRPGTDTAIMLALAHTLVAEDRHDRAFLDRYCTGFERFAPYLTGAADGQPKDADWAAAISGLDAETIRGLARRMAAGRTMITASWSLQRADHGEQPYWMAVVLAAMLGQIGLPGGGFGFGYGCTSGVGNPRRKVAIPRFTAGRPALESWIPVARIADMLLHPGEPYDYNGKRRTYPDIRLVYWAGGNPFHHHQDLNRLVRAFRRPETIVVHEPWWTATARHADIVLPASTTLERNDIGASSLDRFVFAMKKAVEPVGDARSDFDIFTDLARRMGVRDAYTEGRDEEAWLRHMYEVARQQAAQAEADYPDFETFWAAGHLETPAPDAPYVLFADFRADPAAHPLNTPSGRIEIHSERIAGFGYPDCPGHPVWLEPKEWLGADLARTYPLHLMSNQPRTRLHGQLDDGRVSLASKVAGREPCWIHPDDAAPRGIADGDIVRLHNARGACLAGAVLTDAVRPGVVQLATGAWYDPVEPGADGALDAHGNANVLTRDMGTSRLTQGPVAHSALVEVERFDGAPPPITVHRPPPTVKG